MQHNNMFGQSASFHQIVSSIDFNQIGFSILFQHMCNVDWLWIILSNVKFNPIRKNRIENLAQNRIDLMKADFFFLVRGNVIGTKRIEWLSYNSVLIQITRNTHFLFGELIGDLFR